MSSQRPTHVIRLTPEGRGAVASLRVEGPQALPIVDALFRPARAGSVAQAGDGSLRVLDLGDPAVRAAVAAFEGGKVTALYESEHARPYP